MSDIVSIFFQYRVRNRDNSINSFSELKSLINNDIECKQKKISSERIKLKVSRGLWKSDDRTVEVIVNKNLNHLMVLTIDGVRYLKPFEALYLMENHCLEVLFGDIPLSIEESFKLFLENQNQINSYRIFANLLRSGYFVKKHISPQICKLSSNRKRKLSNSDIDYKQLELNINYYELTSKITNYKCIKNMRPIDPMIKPVDCQSSTTFEDNIKKINENTNNFCRNSMIYEIEENESPIQLDPSLTLFNGNVKPLCDLGNVYSNEELFGLIQSSGPKSLIHINDTKSNFDTTLDVFKHSTKKVDQNSKCSVIVTKSDEMVPQIKDIINLQKDSSSKPTYFAVFDSNDFAFYSISCCQLNDEFPILWQKYLKPNSNI